MDEEQGSTTNTGGRGQESLAWTHSMACHSQKDVNPNTKRLLFVSEDRKVKQEICLKHNGDLIRLLGATVKGGSTGGVCVGGKSTTLCSDYKEDPHTPLIPRNA